MGTPTPAPDAKTPKEKKQKEPKEKLPKYVARLSDPAKNSLRFTAKQLAVGASSFATHITRDAEGKAKSVRGARMNHATFDEAKTQVDKGVAAAIKLGWIPRSKRLAGGGKDTFSLESLPTPAAPPAMPTPAPTPAPAAAAAPKK